MLIYCVKCRKKPKNSDPKIFETKYNTLIMQSKCSVSEIKKSQKIHERTRSRRMDGDKFMPEMNLKQPGFIYCVCGPFTKNKGRIEKFMKTGNTDFIYRNDLDKACFQHDLVYGESK